MIHAPAEAGKNTNIVAGRKADDPAEQEYMLNVKRDHVTH